MKQPLLKLVACHRDRDAIGVAIERRARGEKIKGGSLRGCFRSGRSVFKIGMGHVLEFRVVIRVDYP